MNRDKTIANPVPFIYIFEHDILGLILKYLFSITDFKGFFLMTWLNKFFQI